MGISRASGAIDEERGAVFGDSFPWGLGWSARRRCGGVHVASSMGRETCPDSRYHIYRVITSPEMALLWVVEHRYGNSKARARGLRTRSGFFGAGACGRVPESDGKTRVTPWRGAKTRKLRGKGTAKGSALRAVFSRPSRAGLTYAAPDGAGRLPRFGVCVGL